MARKQTPNEPKILVELLFPAEEVHRKLSERIEKGNELKSIQINSIQDLDSTKKSYSTWDSYNNELLKRLFTTDEFAEEYSSWAPIMNTTYKHTFSENIQEFHKAVEDKLHRLDSIIERLEIIPISNTATPSEIKTTATRTLDRNKIFVVHGHDNEAKLEVARFIEKIGFEPIILHEQASGSKTIIEKIEAYSDVGFGVVIYTPCDVGAKSSTPSDLKGRARQNVVFEHGFLIGKLKRSNVCPLVKGKVETPNDISGIVYTSMDNDNWQLKLAKELREAGYSVDMNKVI